VTPEFREKEIYQRQSTGGALLEVLSMAKEKEEAVEAVEQVVEEKKESKAAGTSATVTKIIDAVEKMTVLEMAELVKALEDRFGVTAAAPVVAAAAPAQGAAEGAEEEKTEWDVIIAETGEKKFQVVKVIRKLTDLGLKEAKDLVDNPGQAVQKGVSKEEAEDAKKKLEEAGAKVELK
jgi:large subunit ribosomal protein L7/L12